MPFAIRSVAMERAALLHLRTVYRHRPRLSCQFNIDTACVDVEYEDGFVLSIYTPAVEDAVAHTMQQRSELDWLIYNDPLAYVGLVMSGKSEEYLKMVTR